VEAENRTQCVSTCIQEHAENSHIFLHFFKFLFFFFHNLSKCLYISLYRRKPIMYDYYVCETQLERVFTVRDLGVIYDCSFSFQDHIEWIVKRFLKLLYFIIRHTFSFDNYNNLIYLYKSLILPVLTYASVIWRPSIGLLISRLESVHHKLLRHLSYRFYIPMHRFNHDYSQVSRKFHIGTIDSILGIYDVTFLFKIHKNNINHRDIVNIFPPRSLNYMFRRVKHLAEDACNNNYIFYSSVFRLRRLYNEWYDRFDCIENIHQLKCTLYADIVYY